MKKLINCKCGYNGFSFAKEYKENCFYPETGTHIQFICPLCKTINGILYSNKDGSYTLPILLKRKKLNLKI